MFAVDKSGGIVYLCFGFFGKEEAAAKRNKTIILLIRRL